MVTAPVGILALQGGYQRHADLLERLGIDWCLVRTVADLDRCTALILPGGESTTITRLLQAGNLLPALRRFAHSRPLMGTCAGLILMGRSRDARVDSVEALAVDVERNAYGRQSQSFHADIEIDLGEGMEMFSAVFIRAPRITHVDSEVTVLARHNGVPVLIGQGPHLGMSFHPELTQDARIHRYWLERAAAIASTAVSRENMACSR